MINDAETWRVIERFPNYAVSTCGNVRRIRSASGTSLKVLKQNSIIGYCSCGLWANNKESRQRVHRLVAETFLPNPGNKPEVNHINGVKTDNRVENLEWVTVKENRRHSVDILGKGRGERHHASKLTDNKVTEILEMRASGKEYAEIRKQTGASYSLISGIIAGKRWKHVPRPAQSQAYIVSQMAGKSQTA